MLTMAGTRATVGKACKALRAVALRKPEVEEGVACKGTALESTTFGVGKKVFLFLRIADGTCHLRLKLAESLPEARRLAGRQPEVYAVGAQGWAKVTFELDGPSPPLALLQRWLHESYLVVVGPRPAGRRRTLPPPPPRRSLPPPR